MKFYTKFNPPKRIGVHFNKPTRTDSSFAYDADINNIINGMALTPQQATPPQFGLTFDLDQFQNSLNIVAEARSEFEKLPSAIRREFKNDPKEFINFIDTAQSDEALAKRGVKLGIFKNDILEKFKTVQPALEPTTQPSGDVVSQVTSSD